MQSCRACDGPYAENSLGLVPSIGSMSARTSVRNCAWFAGTLSVIPQNSSSGAMSIPSARDIRKTRCLSVVSTGVGGDIAACLSNSTPSERWYARKPSQPTNATMSKYLCQDLPWYPAYLYDM